MNGKIFFPALLAAFAACAGRGMMVPVAVLPVGLSIPEVVRPGSRAAGDGAKRVFRGSPAEVEAAIAGEWGRIAELTLSRENGALLARQGGSGSSMTMTARFAPAGEGKTEVELLISLSYTLALDRIREMESEHLEKIAADTGR